MYVVYVVDATWVYCTIASLRLLSFASCTVHRQYVPIMPMHDSIYGEMKEIACPFICMKQIDTTRAHTRQEESQRGEKRAANKSISVSKRVRWAPHKWNWCSKNHNLVSAFRFFAFRHQFTDPNEPKWEQTAFYECNVPSSLRLFVSSPCVIVAASKTKK